MIDKKKKGLAKRYQASYESKGSSGNKSGVMDWKKVDGDVEFFSPKEGRNRINIIPYTIKTKNHPLVKRGEFEIGDKDYVMDIFTHRGVGPSEASVVCLKSTYGKPCPICEYAAQLKKQGKEDEAAALKPSRRCFYNVQDCKNPDKLLVFEASHFLFEKELIDEARDDEEGGFVDFADEEAGKEIKFRCSKVSKGGFEFNEFKSFSFEDRDENIPDELLEAAISFDEIMNVPSYEEVEKILYGEDEEDDDEDEDEPVAKPKSKKRAAEEDDDDEEETPRKSKSKRVEKDEDDDEDDDEPEPPKKFKPAKKAVEEDDEDEDDADEKPAKKPVKKQAAVKDEDDDDDDDSDEDDEKPTTKSKSKAVDDEEEEPKSKKKSKTEEDEDDEEEDEKPAKKSSKKNCDGNCPECPFGHKFGEDTDEYDDCDDCDIWDKCINGRK